jgi:hypothetical protein
LFQQTSDPLQCLKLVTSESSLDIASVQSLFQLLLCTFKVDIYFILKSCTLKHILIILIVLLILLLSLKPSERDQQNQFCSNRPHNRRSNERQKKQSGDMGWKHPFRLRPIGVERWCERPKPFVAPPPIPLHQSGGNRWEVKEVKLSNALGTTKTM